MKFELTFKVVLLFSYQGFKLSFFAKAFIFYHITLFLSRTFFKKKNFLSSSEVFCDANFYILTYDF